MDFTKAKCTKIYRLVCALCLIVARLCSFLGQFYRFEQLNTVGQGATFAQSKTNIAPPKPVQPKISLVGADAHIGPSKSAQSQTGPVGTGLRTVRLGLYKCEDRADEGCPTSRLRANLMPRMLSIPHRTDLARLQQAVPCCKSRFHGGRGCVQGNSQGAPAHRASNASGTLTLANGKCGTKQKLRRFVGVLFCVGVYLSSRAATSQVLSAQVSLCCR